jgi:hypothetical protein
VLRQRLALAQQKKMARCTLDELLGPLTMEEKEEATERMLAEKNMTPEAETVTEEQPTITFRAVLR